jgi:hypothetical protein
MSTYTHLGFAGLGFNEFAPARAPAASARPRAGTVSTALLSAVAKVPTTVSVSPLFPTGKTVRTMMPSSVPQQTVDIANAGDPTAPATPSATEPVPVMVFEAPPAAMDWKPVAVGAGVLVAASVALYFATRKGK